MMAGDLKRENPEYSDSRIRCFYCTMRDDNTAGKVPKSDGQELRSGKYWEEFDA
jgi:hypothetical protein